VAIDRRTGRIIGSSRYHGYDPAKREVEVGWTFLARAYWGGRYNGEMKKLMLTHAFRFVDSVLLIIGPENWRSRKAAEKIGAVQDGERRDDSGRESVVYRISAAAFRRS
jgi:RimJ/RimL family protein N-acetyltransferase